MKTEEANIIIREGPIKQGRHLKFINSCIKGISKHKDCIEIKKYLETYPFEIIVNMNIADRTEILLIQFFTAYDTPFYFKTTFIEVTESAKEKFRKILNGVIERLK